MKLPSERLKEIMGQETYNDKQLGRVVEAIIFYLDELHEQQNPCEHNNISNNLVCEDCGEAKR